MGYQLSRTTADDMFKQLKKDYRIFAPMVFPGEGCYSDTDVIRYGEPETLEDIEFERKSDYSFKEALFPVNETLFYFTEEETSVPALSDKGILIFLRSCDLHALKRLDTIYLNNGPEDFYYKRLREKAKFVLMGCSSTCSNGFCASLGTNQTDDYDLYLKISDSTVLADCKCEELAKYFADAPKEDCVVSPEYAAENQEKVTLPKKLSVDTYANPVWDTYTSRCIGCGRCNFVCPTCTCFTMQDIIYRDNANVGERRRVWASCQVDGYTDIAGGGSFRKSQGERMRFKVMHKLYDFEKRFGFPMCVGCGRCDAVCPEYISYANLINKLAKEETCE